MITITVMLNETCNNTVIITHKALLALLLPSSFVTTALIGDASASSTVSSFRIRPDSSDSSVSPVTSFRTRLSLPNLAPASFRTRPDTSDSSDLSPVSSFRTRANLPGLPPAFFRTRPDSSDSSVSADCAVTLASRATRITADKIVAIVGTCHRRGQPISSSTCDQSATTITPANRREILSVYFGRFSVHLHLSEKGWVKEPQKFKMWSHLQFLAVLNPHGRQYIPIKRKRLSVCQMSKKILIHYIYTTSFWYQFLYFRVTCSFTHHFFLFRFTTLLIHNSFCLSLPGLKPTCFTDPSELQYSIFVFSFCLFFRFCAVRYVKLAISSAFQLK